MDINLQREINNINSLLNIPQKEKKILEQQINNFINNNTSNTTNNNIEQEIYKKINIILKGLCYKIATKFNIDVSIIDSIYNNHKIKLKNDYHDNSEQENSSDSDSNSDSDSDDEESQNNISQQNTDNTNNNTICIPINTPNKSIKCPANKGNNGQLCGRMTIKTTNFTYCGYHKKYFKP